VGWRGGWLEGIAWERGAHANYEAGRNTLELCVLHGTAGRCAGDRSIGLRGTFQFYVPKEERCGPGATQFAPADSRDFHACEFNGRGPAIEFERLDPRDPEREPLTDYQIDRGGFIIRSLIALGIPPNYHDGPRLPVGAPFRGFPTHRGLVHNACDQHYDTVSKAEFDRMVAGAGPATDWAAILRWLAAIAEEERRRTVGGPAGYEIGGLQQVDHVDNNGNLMHYYDPNKWSGEILAGPGSPGAREKRKAKPGADITWYIKGDRVDLYVQSADDTCMVHAYYRPAWGWNSDAIGE